MPSAVHAFASSFAFSRGEMRQALEAVQKQIKDTKVDLKEISDLRDKDHKDFQHALKMDRQSVG